MRTLKINLLYQCTAQCPHCRFFCTNDSVARQPDSDTPLAVAARLKQSCGLDMAVVLGGEPTLFPRQTTRLLRDLRALGLATRLETNAWWAKTYASAIELLSPLRDIGTQVMLSLDAFHLPFVSVEAVANAVRACVDLGIDYNLECPYLDSEHKDNAYDRQTLELLRQLRDTYQIQAPAYEGGIVFVGRAAETFGAAFARGRGVPTEACTAVPWWSDSDIASTELLIYEPGGYITKGCGIAIGNVFEQDVADLVRNYRAETHPIFSVLLREGPLGLARMAQQYGYALKTQYADKCHLCQEARQALRPVYPQALQPRQHYGGSFDCADTATA